MDERIFLYKAGEPIPEWDLQHRLPTDTPVGPECKDTATIFRVNSTYKDVTEQPYMYKQLQAGGVLASVFGSGASVYVVCVALGLPNVGMSGLWIFIWLLLFSGITGFGYVAIKFGRDEFFSLKRHACRLGRNRDCARSA